MPGFAGHRKNSIPCSLKGLPQNNSRKMSFVSKRTDALLAEHNSSPPFVKVLYRRTASDDIVHQFRY